MKHSQPIPLAPSPQTPSDTCYLPPLPLAEARRVVLEVGRQAIARLAETCGAAVGPRADFAVQLGERRKDGLRALFSTACRIGELPGLFPVAGAGDLGLTVAELRTELLRVAAVVVPHPHEHARTVANGLRRGAEGVAR